MSAHYHYGAGLHGYLYQDGPHWAETYEDAVQALTSWYSLGTLCQLLNTRTLCVRAEILRAAVPIT